MPSKDYRIYSLESGGGIYLADWIQAASDEEAIAKARKIDHGRALCEVWCKNRLVATLKAGDLADE